jgi:hypothetical protein
MVACDPASIIFLSFRRLKSALAGIAATAGRRPVARQISDLLGVLFQNEKRSWNCTRLGF